MGMIANSFESQSPFAGTSPTDGSAEVAFALPKWMTTPIGEDTSNETRKGASRKAQERGNAYLKRRFGYDAKNDSIGKPSW